MVLDAGDGKSVIKVLSDDEAKMEKKQIVRELKIHILAWEYEETTKQ